MQPNDTTDSLESWLETHSREVCSIIAIRGVLRIFPTLASLIELKNNALPKSGIAFLWEIAASLNTAIHINEVNRKQALKLNRAANTYLVRTVGHNGNHTALYAANDAAAVALSTSEEPFSSIATLAVRNAYAAYNSSSTPAPPSHSIHAPYIKVFFYQSLLKDAEFIDEGHSVKDLAEQPLWLVKDDVRDRMLSDWETLSKHLLTLDQDWEVWIDWYNDRLKGTPFNPTLEYGRISFPEEDYKDAAIVNAKIKAMLEAYDADLAQDRSMEKLVEATPLGEDILLNEEGKFYAKFRPVAEIYENNLSTLTDAIEHVLKENAFNDSSVVIKILNDTISKHFENPQRIHDDCSFVLGRIQSLLDNDVISEGDGIAFLKHALNLNIIDIRTHDQDVKDVFEKRPVLAPVTDIDDLETLDVKEGATRLSEITTESFLKENLDDMLLIKGFDGNQKDAVYRILSRFSRMFVTISRIGKGKPDISITLGESTKIALVQAQPYLHSVIDILRPLLTTLT